MKGLGGLSYAELKAELSSLYAHACDHEHITASDDEPDLPDDDINSLWKSVSDMTEQVWKDKGMPDEIDKNVAAQYAGIFMQGIQKGYGNIGFSGEDYNTPDANMLRNLADNVYQFSAAKNYTQLKELTGAMLNDDGKLRTYNEFKAAALQINNDQVNNWLRTEYDTAIAGAQMASKWVDISGGKDSQMLEFDAIMDGRTTALCGSLNGTRKPADDAFWNTYYPPNHFNCRSTVRQINGGSSTPDKDIEYPDIPKMFQTNLGKQGLVFPPGHAYYKGEAKNFNDVFGKAQYQKDNSHTGNGTVYESGLSYIPPVEGETKTESQKKQELLDKAEYKDRQKVAKTLANYFDGDIFLTPSFSKGDWRYPFYFKGAPTLWRCPDFKIGNEFWEMKSYRDVWKLDKIDNMLNRVMDKKQSHNIIIRITDDADMRKVKNRITGKINGNKEMKEWIKKVIVVNKDMEVIPVLK